MRRISRAIAGLLAFWTTPLAVAAQERGEGGQGVGVGVTIGGTAPVSDYRDIANGAWHVGGFLDFGRVAGPFGVRVDGMYHEFSDKQLAAVGGGASRVAVDNASKIVNGDLNLVLGVPVTSSTIRPYVTGGAGAYYLRSSLKCRSVLLCSGTFDESSETKFGLNGGAGLELGLSGFSAFVEGRYHYVFDALPDLSCIGLPGCGRKAAQFVPLSFGLLYRF